jgi:hypothetical protein
MKKLVTNQKDLTGVSPKYSELTIANTGITGASIIAHANTPCFVAYLDPDLPSINYLVENGKFHVLRGIRGMVNLTRPWINDHWSSKHLNIKFMESLIATYGAYTFTLDDAVGLYLAHCYRLGSSYEPRAQVRGYLRIAEWRMALETIESPTRGRIYTFAAWVRHSSHFENIIVDKEAELHGHPRI